MARGGTIRSLAGAGVLALLLAGCGGGDGDDDTAEEVTTTTESAAETTTESADEPTEDEPADEPASTTAPETTTTTAPGGLSEDEAAAIPEQVDLTLEDVLSFNPTFALQEEDDEEEDDELDECLGELEGLETIAEGEGLTFEAPEGLTGSDTSVLASEDDAVTAVDAFGSEETRACFEDYFSQEGLTAQIDSYPSGARFGDQWAILTGTLDAGGPTASLEIHLVRTGPILTFFLYLDLSGEGETTAYTVDGLLTLIDERQTAALG